MLCPWVAMVQRYKSNSNSSTDLTGWLTLTSSLGCISSAASVGAPSLSLLLASSWPDWDGVGLPACPGVYA